MPTIGQNTPFYALPPTNNLVKSGFSVAHFQKQSKFLLKINQLQVSSQNKAPFSWNITRIQPTFALLQKRALARWPKANH